MPRGNLDDITVAAVLSTSSDIDSENRFSPNRHASITLSGYLKKDKNSLDALFQRANSDADGAVPYRYFMDRRNVRSLKNCCTESYLFLMSYRVEYCPNGAIEVLKLTGLILARDWERDDGFNRVGFFQHDWKQVVDKANGCYPPFIDFDPKSFVRSVITLR
jgi:hypothetical protein